MLHEVVDEDDGQVVDILDLAWPEGLQTGLSTPVALLIDEADETLHAAQRHGFRYFTDIDSFKQYVRKDLLSA